MRAAHVLALLACAPVAVATAQDSLDVRPGVRVRITVPEIGINKHVGVLGVVDGDALAIGTLEVDVASVTRLEVSRGWKRHIGTGVGHGLVLGFISGGAVGVLTYDGPPLVSSSSRSHGLCCADLFRQPQVDLEWVPRMFIGAAIGAGIGAVAGAVVGSAIKTEQWEEVPLDQLRVSVVPQRDGRFAFGLSVAF